MANFLENMFKAAPANQGYAKLDPNSQQLIDKSIQDSQLTPEQHAQPIINQAEQARSLLPTADSLGQKDLTLGGYQDKSMNAALAKRSNKIFERDINKIRLAATLGGYDQASRAHGVAFDRTSAQNAIQLGAYERKAQYDADRARTRQAVLNSILGTAGSIGGYFAGGAAGASAGKQMGSKAAGEVPNG